MDARFHALTDWPAKLTPAHERTSPFRASFPSTLQLLQEELDKLGARDIVIQVALDPSEIRLDGWPKSNARPPRHPGVVLSFESKHGPMRYLTDRFVSYQENLRAIALGLKALRTLDRYGITESGQQYKGWKALETGASAQQEARRTLCAMAGVEYPSAMINGGALYRMAVQNAHPDHGGAPDAFERTQSAAKVLGLR